MEISSKFTGTKLKPFEIRLDARATMNYAAAVNDNNPCYFDDRRAGGLMSHPLNPVAITWNITGRIWEYIEAEDFPLEALLTQVHHTETLVYHRPLVPGDTLTVDGSIVAIEPHRAGTRVVLMYAATGGDGHPVFTEYCGALLRGIACEDGGRRIATLPAIPAPASPAAPLWIAPVDIDPLRAHLYDGCADIHFPIHTSPKFAADVGLPGIILQGTATLAFAVREIVDREADRDPARVQTVSARFTGMVRPGTRMEIRLLACRGNSEGKTLFFEVRNDTGRVAVSDGYVNLERKP